MNSNLNATFDTANIISLVVGIFSVLFIFICIKIIKKLFFTEIEDDSQALILSFGKLKKVIKEPGLHFLPSIFPWVEEIHISTQQDFREYSQLMINDSKGSTLHMDLWLQMRIVDPVKALFNVENWEEALKGYIIHLASSLFSTKEFQQIHTQREIWGKLLKEKLKPQMVKWGLEIDLIYIKKIELTAEISQQIIQSVGARLERTKAKLEEEGRLKVASLEAHTDVYVSELLGQSKGQYPAAIGRAYEKIQKIPAVLEAYHELYGLSQLRPHRTMAFIGFSANELKVTDALMSLPENPHDHENSYKVNPIAGNDM